jgi:hypothetical protein
MERPPRLVTAAPFERFREYTRKEVLGAVDPARPQAAFLLGAGRAACLVRVSRAVDGPRFPSRSDLYWPTVVPPEVTRPGYPLDVLVERVPGTFTYVGEAQIASYSVKSYAKARFGLREMLPRDLWLEAWRAAVGEPTPTQPPIEDIRTLGPTSTASDRLRALRTFVERWYDVRAEPPASSSRNPRVPGPLRELHRILAGAPDAIGQNILLGIDELVPDEGRLIFFRECQGVFEWATEPNGDDPPVWIRNDGSWTPVDAPLSGFAIQMVLAEAITCSPCGAWTIVSEPTAQRLLSRLEPLPLGEWMWPPGTARFYARGSALAQIWTSGGALENVSLAARDPRDLDFAEDLIDASWDRVAF